MIFRPGQTQGTTPDGGTFCVESQYVGTTAIGPKSREIWVVLQVDWIFMDNNAATQNIQVIDSAGIGAGSIDVRFVTAVGVFASPGRTRLILLPQWTLVSNAATKIGITIIRTDDILFALDHM